MTFRHELLVEAFNDPERAPRSGRARLVLPAVLQLLWDAGVAVEFDPPKHVMGWVLKDPETQVFLCRVTLATLPAPDSDAPGELLSLGAAAILWTLLHRDVPEDELDRKEDPEEARRRLTLRHAAQERLRVAFAKLKEDTDGD